MTKIVFKVLKIGGNFVIILKEMALLLEVWEYGNSFFDLLREGDIVDYGVKWGA